MLPNVSVANVIVSTCARWNVLCPARPRAMSRHRRVIAFVVHCQEHCPWHGNEKHSGQRRLSLPLSLFISTSHLSLSHSLFLNQTFPPPPHRASLFVEP